MLTLTVTDTSILMCPQNCVRTLCVSDLLPFEAAVMGWRCSGLGLLLASGDTLMG